MLAKRGVRAPSPEPSKITSLVPEGKLTKKCPPLVPSYLVPRMKGVSPLSNNSDFQIGPPKLSSNSQPIPEIVTALSTPNSQTISNLQTPVETKPRQNSLAPISTNSSQLPSRNETPLSIRSRGTSFPKTTEWKHTLRKHDISFDRSLISTKQPNPSRINSETNLNGEEETHTPSIFQPGNTKPSNKLNSIFSPGQLNSVTISNRTESSVVPLPKVHSNNQNSRSKTPILKSEKKKAQELIADKYKHPVITDRIMRPRGANSLLEKKRSPINLTWKRPEVKSTPLNETRESKTFLGNQGNNTEKGIPEENLDDSDNGSIFSSEEPSSPESPKREMLKPIKAKPEFRLPNPQPAKFSVKGHGIVEAYAAATNQGVVRDYNEDRVSILLNIPRPPSYTGKTWPNCSFFAVLDGHGGSGCADYLKDNLHKLIINDPNFPQNPKEALRKGFEAAEQEFLKIAEQEDDDEQIDKSGSCALAVLIVGDMCYVANVGDSRAVLSSGYGTRIFPLSRDHKPLDDDEQKRITKAGGRVYQSQYPSSTLGITSQLTTGPHRVFPGKLSVSRTFGDIEAKLPKYGGNPKCVIAVPEIKAIQITNDCDFIVIGSDGIFDSLSNRETIDAIWNTFNNYEREEDIHKQSEVGANAVLQESIDQGTSDNVTALIIAFGNLRRKLFPKKSKRVDNKENTENKATISITAKNDDKKPTPPTENPGNVRQNSSTILVQRVPSTTDEGALVEKKQNLSSVVADTNEKARHDISPRILHRLKKVPNYENGENKKPERAFKISEPLPRSKPTETLAQTIARRKLATSKIPTMTKIETSEGNVKLPMKASSLRDIN